MASDLLSIEVAYARPDRQEIVPTEVPPGATVYDAIIASGICTMFPEIDANRAAVGVWGKRAALETRLQTGDRVEIYRSLIADPKQARRQRAARNSKRPTARPRR